MGVSDIHIFPKENYCTWYSREKSQFNAIIYPIFKSEKDSYFKSPHFKNKSCILEKRKCFLPNSFVRFSNVKNETCYSMHFWNYKCGNYPFRIVFPFQNTMFTNPLPSVLRVFSWSLGIGNVLS